MSALFGYGQRHPFRTRRRRILWAVVMLALCLPVAGFLGRGAAVAWRDVLAASDLPPWLESEQASVWDALLLTFLGSGLLACSVVLVVALVRMVLLRWDGPTWREPG